MTPTTAATLELNNGVTMPALGLGVFQTPPDETTDAVDIAARSLWCSVAYGPTSPRGSAWVSR